VVRYLAGERGIRQFLDIGPGLPAPGATHTVAQAIAAQSRVVYADNDPLVLAHARALLTSTGEGVCEYLDADLRDPEAILKAAAQTLDFTQPAAVILVAVLHFLADADDPAGVVATLAAAFVRPQASPVSAVSGAFIGQIPAALRNHLMAHFGAHGQTVLMLGTIGLAAIVLGCMARRNASVGVTGIAAFGLLGAFVAITRPESRASDVIPSAVGALAGIVALLWLARASAPAAPAPGVASLRPADGGGRRRAR